MRTHARRFRSIVPHHPPRPRPALPRDPDAVVLCHLPEGGAAPAPAPSSRLKAWLRVGAHSLLALLWVVLPQLIGSRARESEPLVVEVERPCACERAAGPSLRESLVPRDDAALDRDEAAPAPRAFSAARGFCADDASGNVNAGAIAPRAFLREP